MRLTAATDIIIFTTFHYIIISFLNLLPLQLFLVPYSYYYLFTQLLVCFLVNQPHYHRFFVQFFFFINLWFVCARLNWQVLSVFECNLCIVSYRIEQKCSLILLLFACFSPTFCKHMDILLLIFFYYQWSPTGATDYVLGSMCVSVRLREHCEQNISKSKSRFFYQTRAQSFHIPDYNRGGQSTPPKDLGRSTGPSAIPRKFPANTGY